MIDALIGSALGGIFRLIPEGIKFFDRKNERAHELAMFDLQIEADKLKGQMALAEADAKIGAAEIQAIIAATKAQGMKTGIRWVDAINALMRPLITFWWVICLNTVAMIAEYSLLLHQGVSGIDAILQLWGSEEKAIVASIISFWFIDRSLRKDSVK